MLNALCSASAPSGARDEDAFAAGTHDDVIVALRRAEEKYRSIFENAIEGIFRLRPMGST